MITAKYTAVLEHASVKISENDASAEKQKSNQVQQNYSNVDLKQLASELNKILSSSDMMNRKVELSYNENINRIIITVMNKETGSIIAEIPCKEIQNLALHLKEAIGIVIDNNA